jgi:hypothetical protein
MRWSDAIQPMEPVRLKFVPQGATAAGDAPQGNNGNTPTPEGHRPTPLYNRIVDEGGETTGV